MVRLLPYDPEKARLDHILDKNVQYLVDHWDDLRRHHGDRFVALDDGRVICAARTGDEAWRCAKRLGADRRTCIVEFIPRSGLKLAY